MVEGDCTEEWIIMRARCSEKSAMWNAIAHIQPLPVTVREGIIKRFFVARARCVICASVLTELSLSLDMSVLTEMVWIGFEGDFIHS